MVENLKKFGYVSLFLLPRPGNPRILDSAAYSSKGQSGICNTSYGFPFISSYLDMLAMRGQKGGGWQQENIHL